MRKAELLVQLRFWKTELAKTNCPDKELCQVMIEKLSDEYKLLGSKDYLEATGVKE